MLGSLIAVTLTGCYDATARLSFYEDGYPGRGMHGTLVVNVAADPDAFASEEAGYEVLEGLFDGADAETGYQYDYYEVRLTAASGDLLMQYSWNFSLEDLQAGVTIKEANDLATLRINPLTDAELSSPFRDRSGIFRDSSDIESGTIWSYKVSGTLPDYGEPSDFRFYERTYFTNSETVLDSANQGLLNGGGEGRSQSSLEGYPEDYKTTYGIPKAGEYFELRKDRLLYVLKDTAPEPNEPESSAEPDPRPEPDPLPSEDPDPEPNVEGSSAQEEVDSEGAPSQTNTSDEINEELPAESAEAATSEISSSEVADSPNKEDGNSTLDSSASDSNTGSEDADAQSTASENDSDEGPESSGVSPVVPILLLLAAIGLGVVFWRRRKSTAEESSISSD